MNEPKTFMVEDATLIFRNFSGNEGMYNPAGSRNFGVILDQKTAEKMLKDGWNVKFPDSREEGEERDPYISIQLGFKVRPPKIVMITSAGRTNLTEETVSVLDWADVRTADLICNGSYWEVNGKTGIKAYLKSLFVTIEEDALDLKYAVELLNDGQS